MAAATRRSPRNERVGRALRRHVRDALLLGAEQQGETPFTFDGLVDAPEGTPAVPAIQVVNAIQPAFVGDLADRPHSLSLMSCGVSWPELMPTSAYVHTSDANELRQ